MRLTLTGCLVAALTVSVAWGAFATFRWAAASARCEARIVEARAQAQADAAEESRRQQLTAAGIFAAEAIDLALRLERASNATATRAAQIARVPVTGACTMPAGLPSLQPAVEDARRAARD